MLLGIKCDRRGMAMLVLATALESSVPRLYLISVLSFSNLLIGTPWLGVTAASTFLRAATPTADVAI
jgi:hypothetical protein